MNKEIYTSDVMASEMAAIQGKALEEIRTLFEALKVDGKADVAGFEERYSTTSYHILTYNHRADYYFYSPIKAIKDVDGHLMVETEDETEECVGELSIVDMWAIIACLEEIYETK